ncbi:uncharacterized protein [Amphiura filiformis]|uniref:uncharacterized protein n=1 Tax=Amphiura filiformis TaxID=82378 RepID=UPI003B2282BA
MSQGNVKNFAAMFNQQQQPLIKPGGLPPKPKPKPPVPVKDSSNGNTNHVNGVHSTTAPVSKRFTPPAGSLVGIPHNLDELHQVKLRRAPPPKKPEQEPPSESPFNRRPSLNRPKPDINTPKPVIQPRPKPRPAVIPRKSTSSSSGTTSPIAPTNTNELKSDADDSTSISSFSDSSLPRTSTTESNTSRTESNTSRRTSGKPELQFLPPVEILGSAPPKPRKPMTSVVLPSPTPTVLIKPSSKRSSFLYKRHDSSSTTPEHQPR